MKIVFIDKNKSLVSKVRKAVKHLPFKIVVKSGDIFAEKGVIVSASNPMFSMGGGLDAFIAEKYPEECSKIDKSKGNQRIGDIIFTVTVGEDFKATRELVAKALKFAMDNGHGDDVLLISGLGTGIGGLDEDDFVWMFLQAVCEVSDYGYGIKFTQKDGSDFRTGEVFYEVGKWIEQKGAEKDGADCGVGLHLGKSFIGAGNYNTPDKILFCIYHKDALCGEGSDKVRVSRLLTVSELPQWLGYGENGKNIVSKIGKEFDPEQYNPYQATELPSLKTIKEKLKSPLDQVRAQVRDQIRKQVGSQICDQVRKQICDQVRKQVCDQVWDQVGDQVWDRIWATSYWFINVHFELGISHWFGDFLSLGIMPIFVNGKMKIFGKKGMYLGEYDEKEFLIFEK
jgi:hypothetical protein